MRTDVPSLLLPSLCWRRRKRKEDSHASPLFRSTHQARRIQKLKSQKSNQKRMQAIIQQTQDLREAKAQKPGGFLGKLVLSSGVIVLRSFISYASRFSAAVCQAEHSNLPRGGLERRESYWFIALRLEHQRKGDVGCPEPPGVAAPTVIEICRIISYILKKETYGDSGNAFLCPCSTSLVGPSVVQLSS